jgi:hypothetical protein
MDKYGQFHIRSTAQQFLEIEDITNDMLILQDGVASMILTVNSLNFGLLSEEEQDAIIYTYAGMLNSLSFPIQIVIRSQRKDISSYLSYVDEKIMEMTNAIRKQQLRHYRAFVEDLVRETNILDKKFYIVIPCEITRAVDPSLIPKVKKKQKIVLDKKYIIEKATFDLEPKRDHLISQFGRIGLRARQLNTKELIHLMYILYNPDSEGQFVSDTKSYTTPIVEASIEGIPRTVQSEQTVMPNAMPPAEDIMEEAPVEMAVEPPMAAPAYEAPAYAEVPTYETPLTQTAPNEESPAEPTQQMPEQIQRQSPPLQTVFDQNDGQIQPTQ